MTSVTNMKNALSDKPDTNQLASLVLANLRLGLVMTVLKVFGPLQEMYESQSFM